jgi:serine protease Do
VAAVVVAALAAGAFFLLGGDDDEVASDDTTTTTEEEDPDDTTTTTEDVDDTTTTAPEDTTTTGVPGVEFVPLTDATGRLTVEVPSDWTDVVLSNPEIPDVPSIEASTDLQGFRTAFEVPGMAFALFGQPPEGGFDSLLDFLAASANLPNACVSAGKQDYDDGVFVGRFEVWQECANIGTQIVMISAAQADGQTIGVQVQLPEGEPIEIAQHIAETFFIVG